MNDKVQRKIIFQVLIHRQTGIITPPASLKAYKIMSPAHQASISPTGRFTRPTLSDKKLGGFNRIKLPVIGIPEKPCLDFAATTSPTQLSGLRTNGSKMKPCSNFLTFLTSLAWNSTEQL